MTVPVNAQRPKDPGKDTNTQTTQNHKVYVRGKELEERTRLFARDVRLFLRCLPLTESNREDGVQLIRASGSIGANYIEANGSLGKKDFLMRVRIARKEAKESEYWLTLLNTNPLAASWREKERLIDEARQLRSILSSIILNTEKSR